MSTTDQKAIARRRLVAQLARHFHDDWSNDQVRDHYPDGVAVQVEGETVQFPAGLLDDAFLEKARQLYQHIVAADKPRH